MKKQTTSPRSKTKKQAVQEESELWLWASQHHRKRLEAIMKPYQKTESTRLQQLFQQRAIAFLKMILPIFKKGAS